MRSIRELKFRAEIRERTDDDTHPIPCTTEPLVDATRRENWAVSQTACPGAASIRDEVGLHSSTSARHPD